jgi:Fe-S-cluster-containing hydrogenase component 2
MEKMIVLDYDKCIGCRTCETVCSLSHEARINVVKYEQIGTNIPMLCLKCEKPACMAACPMKAITFNLSLGTQRATLQ